MARGRSLPLARAAVCAALAVLIALGSWQLYRMQWKQGLIEARVAAMALPPLALPREPADRRAVAEDRRVTVRGRFRHEAAFRFPARTRNGRVGVELVTPLVRAQGDVVLVNRGWLPVGAPLDTGAEAGEVEVSGLLRRPSPPGRFTPENRPETNEWYWYDLQAMARRLDLAAAPALIERGVGEDPRALPRGRAFTVTLPDNHLQYALTWYALAGVLLAMLVAGRLRGRRSGGDGG